MHTSQSHLDDLRRHASRSRAAAIEIQRALTRKLADPETCTLVTDLEQQASAALMKLAFAAESLYLQEVIRSNAAVLERIAEARSPAMGGRGSSHRD